MTLEEMAGIVEAILFVAGEPVNIGEMIQNLGFDAIEANLALDSLENRLKESKSGLVLKRFGSHIQLATNASYAPFIEKMLQPTQKQALSKVALETLAYIAYFQPVTKGDIEKVRGVKCDYSVQSLLNKGLIEEVGRRDSLGHPILYGTTDSFLAHFGLSALSELPEIQQEALAGEAVEESDLLFRERGSVPKAETGDQQLAMEDIMGEIK